MSLTQVKEAPLAISKFACGPSGSLCALQALPPTLAFSTFTKASYFASGALYPLPAPKKPFVEAQDSSSIPVTKPAKPRQRKQPLPSTAVMQHTSTELYEHHPVTASQKTEGGCKGQAPCTHLQEAGCAEASQVRCCSAQTALLCELSTQGATPLNGLSSMQGTECTPAG